MRDLGCSFRLSLSLKRIVLASESRQDIVPARDNVEKRKDEVAGDQRGDTSGDQEIPRAVTNGCHRFQVRDRGRLCSSMLERLYVSVMKGPGVVVRGWQGSDRVRGHRVKFNLSVLNIRQRRVSGLQRQPLRYGHMSYTT